jgi:hypothetical protein
MKERDVLILRVLSECDLPSRRRGKSRHILHLVDQCHPGRRNLWPRVISKISEN